MAEEKQEVAYFAPPPIQGKIGLIVEVLNDQNFAKLCSDHHEFDIGIKLDVFYTMGTKKDFDFTTIM